MGRKFEYRGMDIDLVATHAEYYLNKLGGDGWELVAVVQPRVSVPPVFYFKRELDEPRTKA